MALNPERIALLTAALRSGEYSQTISKLSDGESFCCLGVACDIYMKQTGQGAWKPTMAGGMLFDAGPGDQSRMTLPDTVREWYGFKGNGGEFTKSESNGKNALWKFNDYGHTFEQMAEVIENNMDNL